MPLQVEPDQRLPRIGPDTAPRLLKELTFLAQHGAGKPVAAPGY